MGEMNVETTKMGTAQNGRMKGFQHYLGSFLGLCLKDKECLNDVKYSYCLIVVSERTMPSSSIAINGEPHKKKTNNN